VDMGERSRLQPAESCSTELSWRCSLTRPASGTQTSEGQTHWTQDHHVRIILPACLPLGHPAAAPTLQGASLKRQHTTHIHNKTRPSFNLLPRAACCRVACQPLCWHVPTHTCVLHAGTWP
jgi:hypothetical protein